MRIFLLLDVVAVIGISVAVAGHRALGSGRIRREDAETDARRWVDRLSGIVVNLDGGSNVAAWQALADAAERLTAASSQLCSAETVTQFALVSRGGRRHC